MIQKIKEAVNFIQQRFSGEPQFGIILGTGLGSLVNDVEAEHTIDYDEIPHFPVSTVESHSGKLIFGKLSGKNVVVMQGRFHYYEGYSMEEVTFPVRVLKLLGIRKLFISNAAGGLNPEYQISDLMIIEDHINLLPENPLRGKNLDEFGGRFPDMSEPYDLSIVDQALDIAKSYNIPTHKGVYVSVPGPNLETRAEYKYLRIIGADAVGMSTVPENIVARHMDLPCFAISVITDLCTPGNIKKISVEEVIAAAMKAEPGMTQIMRELIRKQ
ncbi:purine-nucleoside phosphorylase [Fulvivirgaceae bacterium BMA10]|uniref:Purine nucleoside phosphorylase n=1 Tax=Splendidivirga corallicola TaxID=3051826 RepID=A0ABT8KGW9_9BACT|nr:purine-nucleoside phosphorylase [Fulvivirgaceae bacterium BMA10]